MKTFLTTLLIIFSLQVFAQKYTLSGYVKDNNSGEELIGASVFIKDKNDGSYTNYYGYYSITLPKGTYEIEYSYMGYETSLITVDLTKSVTKNVELELVAQKVETVTVSAVAKDKNVTSTEMGVQTLQMQDIKTIPVLFGENDVLKTLQLMPGIKGAGEGNSGYYVRGGGADQNLILLDEAPVYNASHMLGFFSVFNGDAIRDVKMYKGSMPAEYGGRLSSVLDIKMKEGNMRKYQFTGGIGTISSRLAVEGPIKKDTSSFIIAARRTYADIFLNFAKDTNIRNTKMYFYDLNLKANYRINSKNRVFLSGYLGKDLFGFQDMFGTNWGNATATFRWVHLFSPKLFLNSTLVYSNFNNSTGMQNGSENIDISSGIDDWHLKEDFQYYVTSKTTIKFGLDAIFHTFTPSDLFYQNSTEGIDDVEIKLDKKHALESSLYASIESKLTDRLKINFGLRTSNFTVLALAKDTVYSYEYNDENERTDSSAFSRGSIMKNYPSLEPRLSLTYQFGTTSSLKASFVKSNQFIHLIQSSTISMPTDFWIPSTENTPPQRCFQYSLGYFRNFFENTFETSVELYYKDLKSQIDYKSGTDIFANPNLEAYLLFGKGRSFGAEFLIKKNSGRLTGWIGYTISKTEKQFKDLNANKWFPARYDRVHDISIVAMFDLTEKIQLSATWVYNTGDAVTLPSGKYLIDGMMVNYFTERNGYRMPDYHRADLGVTINLAKREKFESALNISIYNVYSRKNAYMMFFEPVDKDDPQGELQLVKVTLFPILPSVTWNFKF